MYTRTYLKNIEYVGEV